MKTIKITWKGGPKWNPLLTSSINPSKNKSAIEHLIETGGQTIDETMLSLQKFSSFPLDITQTQPDDPSINWITTIGINETDQEILSFIENLIMEHYTAKKKWLKTSTTGYSIDISIE